MTSRAELKFLFDLCVLLGFPSPRALRAELSGAELAAWSAYMRAEPQEPYRGDFRAALIAKVIADVNRDPKKSRGYDIKDFMPLIYGGEQKRLTPKQSADYARMLSGVYGGRIIQQNEGSE